jgi:hypothetical protein
MSWMALSLQRKVLDDEPILSGTDFNMGIRGYETLTPGAQL